MRGRFKDATEQMLGTAITPHHARHIAVTAIAEARPDQIGIATPLLGHARQRTTLAHYNLADQLSAGRDFNAALSDIRAEAHDAMRGGTLFEEEPPT